MFVRIAYDPGHTGERRQLFGRALRVATSYEDFAIRIDALQSAYRCPRVFICGRCNCASIQHYNFSVASCFGAIESAREKLALQRSPVRLGSATAKIFYVEARHAPILNEQAPRLNKLY